MKRFFVLLSAVALFGLTSCSMQEQLGPKAEGVKNDVKSAFSFNVATKTNTKATAEDVQANGNFRGMTGMNLFVTTGNPAEVDFMPGYQYPLGSLATAALDGKSSKVYYLSLPVGVDNMVFYGRASRGESSQNPNPSPERYGQIKYNVGPNKQSTNFQSVPILADASAFTDVSTKLAKIMNDVFDPRYWPDPESEYTGINDRALVEIYKRVTEIRQGEFRDGSGAAILRILQEVRRIVDLQIEEAGIPGLLDPTGTVTDPTWDISNVTSAISVRLAVAMAIFEPDDEGQYNAVQPVTTLGSPELDGFPGNLGLPAGSAQLTYVDGKFAYANEPDAFGGATSQVASVTKFTYPVELTYYVNSPVRVTSQAVKEEDFPITVPTWSAADWGTKWPQSGINGVIAPETQGVALQNNIQYGTALLKTTVKYGAEVLEDNTHNMAIALEPTANVPNQQITVDDKSFTLKGILVGGQPGQVDWQWVGSGEFGNVVYDHNFTAAAATIPTPQGDAAYTMVFDNLQAGETADQADVFVALELVNNAKDAQGNPMDFYGRDNLIPAGGTFYLVGKLDFANADKSGIEYPVNKDGNGLRYPPFSGVNNKEVIRVFMQDFVTEANFTINSLKNAYVTVPDLRNLEMTFGLSVDLDWQAGLSFDVVLN